MSDDTLYATDLQFVESQYSLSYRHVSQITAEVGRLLGGWQKSG